MKWLLMKFFSGCEIYCHYENYLIRVQSVQHVNICKLINSEIVKMKLYFWLAGSHHSVLDQVSLCEDKKLPALRDMAGLGMGESCSISPDLSAGLCLCVSSYVWTQY